MIGGKSKGVARQVETAKIPAPLLGIDATQSLSGMSASNCIYCYNITPKTYGLGLRHGYKEYVTEIPSDGSGVRSVIPYKGSDINTDTDDKVFVATNTGIYDVTDQSIAPVEKVAFLLTTFGAGYGVSLQYVDEGGNELVFFADEANGLFQYDAATDTWAVPTGITGIDMADVVFIMVHKLRIWMVERDSTTAYYLPTTSVAGAVVPFHFGSKFPHGGNLAGLYNWTIDGGAGVDDVLVAISDSGDVLPFSGEDPSLVDSWKLTGSYFIGSLPMGRRFADESGGNLHILSSYGVISLADLLRGVDPKREQSQGIAAKISPVIRRHMAETRFEYGWEIIYAPAQGSFIINSPPESGAYPIQYVMDLTTEGWGYWRDIKMNVLAEFRDKIFFGYGDVLYYMDGFLDNVKKEYVEAGDEGVPIAFSMMTSFSDIGSPATFKSIQFIRPDFIAHMNPKYATKAVYDYNIAEPSVTPPLGQKGSDLSLWDASLWDQAVWATSWAHGFSRLSGGTNIGRTAAIAIKGSSTDDIRLVSVDVAWTTGGFL